MNDVAATFLSIFTGKGGTIKFTIFCSLLAAFTYEMMDSGYGFSASNQNGSVSFRQMGNNSTDQTKSGNFKVNSQCEDGGQNELAHIEEIDEVNQN